MVSHGDTADNGRRLALTGENAPLYLQARGHDTMPQTPPPFQNVTLSLADLVGHAYIDAVCEARAALAGEDVAALRAVAQEKVDCYPDTFQARLLELLPRVGERLCAGTSGKTAAGATSAPFQAATSVARSPLSGFGFYRLGEDGRLYLITKSEHYHVPLGHAFPGYALIDRARRLGIPNATHNNTRGHITRLLEEKLVAAAGAGTDRVLNLETGSLAAEAALKMILARFYRSEPGVPPPPYAGRRPVVLVLGTDDGAVGANYHGTTLLTQAMRGMWPEFQAGLAERGLFDVAAIRPNRIEDLEEAFRRREGGATKIAGFFHEIIMMNYGGRRIEPAFLARAYELCERHDVPTVADEIQSCVWAPRLFLFHEYGIRPTFVVVGKGFSGGEFPASRILFSGRMDSLPQFGALVTNGQEEIASLAYLITMRWAEANAAATRRIGDYHEGRLRELAAAYPAAIEAIDGARHLSTIRFARVDRATAFARRLSDRGLDVSVQTYKADCPPVVMMKLPLTVVPPVVDWIVARMREALEAP
jgi:acetylornithine/succinyldiaminopimelate/putrescine aminotransferase